MISDMFSMNLELQKVYVVPAEDCTHFKVTFDPYLNPISLVILSLPLSKNSSLILMYLVVFPVSVYVLYKKAKIILVLSDKVKDEFRNFDMVMFALG